MADTSPIRILVVDNYDSFVWNIVQYLAQIGATVDVVRNDDACFDDATWAGGYHGILLSPGPGTPDRAGVCPQIVRDVVEGRVTVPVFGICLGLQVMCEVLGGRVERAPEIHHGKTSLVDHDGRGAFTGLASPLVATRYHSLAANPDLVPTCLEVSARTADGIVMGVRHRELPLEGVQFHPESVLSEGGYQMLANWLAACGDTDAPRRAAGLGPLVSARVS